MSMGRIIASAASQGVNRVSKLQEFGRFLGRHSGLVGGGLGAVAGYVGGDGSILGALGGATGGYFMTKGGFGGKKDSYRHRAIKGITSRMEASLGKKGNEITSIGRRNMRMGTWAAVGGLSTLGVGGAIGVGGGAIGGMFSSVGTSFGNETQSHYGSTFSGMGNGARF